MYDLPIFGIVWSPHLWEAGRLYAPPKICVRNMCWISQLAERPHAKSISEIGSQAALESPATHTFHLCPSPNFYRGSAKIYKMINNSAVDCSISVKFGNVWSRDIRCTTNVKGQVSKVKVTARKRRLFAKL